MLDPPLHAPQAGIIAKYYYTPIIINASALHPNIGIGCPDYSLLIESSIPDYPIIKNTNLSLYLKSPIIE